MMLLWAAVAAASPVADQLRARDGVECVALGEASAALRDELLALAAPATLPASVPMRAAQCLAERFGDDAAVITELSRWADDPARPGQVLLLLARAETLPEPVAVAVVGAALRSPHTRVSARAGQLVAVSARPALRALAPAP